MKVSLRVAADRVRDATPEETEALLTDLRYEMACLTYQMAHAAARIGVLRALLAAKQKRGAA